METKNLQQAASGTVPENATNQATIKDLVNTPFKKVVFVILVISIFLTMGGFALVGTGLGALLQYNASQIAILTSVVFVIGEVFFFGSLAVLGKQAVTLVKEKIKAVFKKKKD